jgi:hypothetical protein
MPVATTSSPRRDRLRLHDRADHQGETGLKIGHRFPSQRMVHLNRLRAIHCRRCLDGGAAKKAQPVMFAIGYVFFYRQPASHLMPAGREPVRGMA